MFEEFWSKYPKKVAKLAALKAWNKLDDDRRKKAIDVLQQHCKRWDDMQFIPHASTWLNGERWDDVIEDSQPKQKTVAWWSNDQDTLAYGNQKGLRPRPGESMGDYRSRLRAA